MACSLWNQPGIRIERQCNYFRSCSLHFIRYDVPVNVESGLNVTVPHEFLLHSILSQLREIHDGEFRKTFGTGQTKVWQGRITMVAAVTPVIDHYSSVFSVLGERFLQVRWSRPQSPKAGQIAIRQQGSELAIRQALQRALKVVFDNATKRAPKLDARSGKRLASAAELVAIGRTHVYRNSYGNREIESTPQPEGNSRIAKGLAGIAKGVASLNGRLKVEEADLQDAFRVALAKACRKNYTLQNPDFCGSLVFRGFGG